MCLVKVRLEVVSEEMAVEVEERLSATPVPRDLFSLSKQ